MITKRHNSLNASCQYEYRQNVKYVSTDRLILDLTHQGRFNNILNQIQNYIAYWIPMQVSQCIIEQKIFWIQKILLEEFVCVYQIQRIWNTYVLSSNARPYVDLSTVEKDPTFSSQRGMDVHTTSRRNLRDTHSSSRQLIFHFKPN